LTLTEGRGTGIPKILKFGEGDLLAVNLGNDADTTGAVYGQIAGAYYGYAGIPEEWRSGIAHRELIESYADQLNREGRRLRKPDV